MLMPSFSASPCSLPSPQPCVPAPPGPPDSARPRQAPPLLSLVFSLLLPSLRPWTIGMFSLIPPPQCPCLTDSCSETLLLSSEAVWPHRVNPSSPGGSVYVLSASHSPPVAPLYLCSGQTGQLIFQNTPHLSHLQTLHRCCSHPTLEPPLPRLAAPTPPPCFWGRWGHFWWGVVVLCPSCTQHHRWEEGLCSL